MPVRSIGRTADEGKVSVRYRRHDEDVDLPGRLCRRRRSKRPKPVDVDGTPLRIIHAPGKAHLTGFALEAGAYFLRWLAAYYDIPYPGDKMDFIAIPDFAFGAMENVGAVTYRENAVLVDPHVARQTELERVSSVIAHELAHMWFGNLVTMKWWNGIWLNEAFATFMEMMASDAFRPEWKTWLEFAPSRGYALDTDALASTRPVEFDVDAPDEADQMFDSLTYSKGSALLRMLQQFLGEETFRQGVGDYLRAHAYGNTETHDLWSALEKASGRPVGAMMNSWIFQGGFPEVEISHSPEGDGLLMEQRRFGYLPSVSGGEWHVPIVVRLSDGQTEETSTAIVGVTPEEDPGERTHRVGRRQRRREWLLPGQVHARVDGQAGRPPRPARSRGAVHAAGRHVGARQGRTGRLRHLPGPRLPISGGD